MENKSFLVECGWVIKDKFIEKEFVFKDFNQAFAFMTSVAMVVEQVNHHPNWENVYNKVKIAISTHSADALTEKDYDLAQKIELKHKFFQH
jgi:4a-hydroxytetrahydrobiopterin dehydratase